VPRLSALPATLLLLALLPASALAEPPFATPGHAAKALESRDLAARLLAARWLGTVTDAAERPRVLRLLSGALRDADPGVRRAAATSLGSIADGAAGPALRDALSAEAEVPVVPSLLLALGAVRDEASRPLVAARLAHAWPSVRAAALLALGDLGGDASRVAALAALRDPGGPDPTFEVRSAAVLALARCGRRGDMDAILAAYRAGNLHRSWFARAALVRAAAALEPEPVPFLLHYVHDEDSRVGVTAAEGLARSGHEDEVHRLLIHPAPEVRAAAAAAVEQARVASAYERLRRMARLDRSRLVRWSCTLALFRLGDPEGDALVLEAVSASEPAIWAEAVAVLAARTGAEHGRNVSAWREELRRLRAR
jgi:HEAT repeat protein